MKYIGTCPFQALLPSLSISNKLFQTNYFIKTHCKTTAGFSQSREVSDFSFITFILSKK